MATAVTTGHEALRVGVIGAGGNTRTHHIPKLIAIDGVEVVAIANRSVESSKKAIAELGLNSTTEALDDPLAVIKNPSINAIVIGTWPYLHPTLTIAALNAGKHVMTEARMSTNAREAHEMLRASHLNPKLVTQVVPSPFTLPFDATIQDIIKEQVLGDLVYIEVRGAKSQFAAKPGAPLDWRTDFQYSGYNIMMLGIFYEPLQRWVGDAKSVLALAKTVVKLRTNSETGEPAAPLIPDHLNILAEMACGAQAHIVISNVLGAPPSSNFCYTLHGTQGTLHLDVQKNKLLLGRASDGGELKEVNIDPSKQAGWRVEEEFVNAIRGKEKIRRTTFEQGVRYMEFTEAVTRSFQTGSKVHLPLPL